MQPQKEVAQGDATNESLPPSCGHPRRLDLTSCDSVLPRPDRPSDRKSARPEEPTLMAFSAEKHALLSAPQHHGVQKTLKKKEKKKCCFCTNYMALDCPDCLHRDRPSQSTERRVFSSAVFSSAVGRETSRCSGRRPNVSSPVSLRPHLGRPHNEKGYRGGPAAGRCLRRPRRESSSSSSSCWRMPKRSGRPSTWKAGGPRPSF